MTRLRSFPSGGTVARVAVAGIAASLLGAGHGAAQSSGGITRADSAVAAWVGSERIPGAVMLVSRHDTVVFERAYGWAQLYDYGEGQYPGRGADAPTLALRRLEAPRPMTVETVFDLASVTKVMATTMAAMILVDRGRLDLDAPISTYFRNFTGGGKDSITARLLLNHRSGLTQWQPIYYHADLPELAYNFIKDFPLEWGVGEGRHYSDLGFMMMGFVVERTAGLPLELFLERELYGPLGLEATGFRAGRPIGGVRSGGPYAATSHGNPYEYRMVHDSTFGYRIAGDPDAWDGWRRRTLVGEVNDGNAYYAFGGIAGHAGLFSTARELQVLLQLLLNRGEYGGHRYISPEVVDAFLAPGPDGQALGWQTPPYLPPTSFAHTGFTGTYVLGVSDRGLAVVLLTNRQNVGVDGRGLYPDVGPLQRVVSDALTGG